MFVDQAGTPVTYYFKAPKMLSLFRDSRDALAWLHLLALCGTNPRISWLRKSLHMLRSHLGQLLRTGEVGEMAGQMRTPALQNLVWHLLCLSLAKSPGLLIVAGSLAAKWEEKEHICQKSQNRTHMKHTNWHLVLCIDSTQDCYILGTECRLKRRESEEGCLGLVIVSTTYDLCDLEWVT